MTSKINYIKLFIAFACIGQPLNISAIEMGAPNVKADTYIVIDHETGTTLTESNSTEHKSIASLTKLMTAYVAFDEIKLGTLSPEDPVRISTKAWKTKGSRMFIEQGNTVTINELLSGLLAVSGNDAAVAIAEHISGSEEEFVSIMNAQAYKLGMRDTIYGNATGLPTKSINYSTARDIATLTRALINEFPEQYEKFSNKHYTYNDIPQKNRNALLFESPSYDGLKTGYTRSAGYCLSTSFNKADRRVITVILGAKSSKERFASAKALTNYGFRRFYNVTTVQQGVSLHQMPVFYGDKSNISVAPSEGHVITLPRQLGNISSESDVSVTAFFDANGEEGSILFAPVEKAYVVGQIDVTYKNELIKSIPLVTKAMVKEGNWRSKLKDWFYLNLFSKVINWFKEPVG